MLVPFRLSDHLIHYFFREFSGMTRRYLGREVKVIPLDKNSVVGKYIIANLKKTDYPTARIREFTLFVEMANVERKMYCTKQKLFKKENLENSFVELPDEFMNDVEDFLDDIFRQNFFWFVHGSVSCGAKVQTVIKQFMDKYNLWDLGFDVEQLRQQYYRMQNDGPASRLQNMDRSYGKKYRSR